MRRFAGLRAWVMMVDHLGCTLSVWSSARQGRNGSVRRTRLQPWAHFELLSSRASNDDMAVEFLLDAWSRCRQRSCLVVCASCSHPTRCAKIMSRLFQSFWFSHPLYIHRLIYISMRFVLRVSCRASSCAEAPVLSRAEQATLVHRGHKAKRRGSLSLTARGYDQSIQVLFS